jgi:hypothetical protein
LCAASALDLNRGIKTLPDKNPENAAKSHLLILSFSATGFSIVLCHIFFGKDMENAKS